jgi:hypothetical protein
MTKDTNTNANKITNCDDIYKIFIKCDKYNTENDKETNLNNCSWLTYQYNLCNTMCNFKNNSCNKYIEIIGKDITKTTLNEFN